MPDLNIVFVKPYFLLMQVLAINLKGILFLRKNLTIPDLQHHPDPRHCGPRPAISYIYFMTNHYNKSKQENIIMVSHDRMPDQVRHDGGGLRAVNERVRASNERLCAHQRGSVHINEALCT